MRVTTMHETPVALVTGGARGIGESISRLLAQHGHTLVINYFQSEERAARLVVELQDQGHQAVAIQCDVGKRADRLRLVDEAMGHFGRIDLLVCSAGVLMGAYDGIADLEEEAWDATIDTNLKGTYLCTKFAAPWLRRAQRSVLLLIASGAGVRGASSSFAYAASKAGIHGMQYNFERDLGASGTRVHVICPGGIATPLKLLNIAQGATARGEDSDAAVANARQSLGDPAGVARILTFLASDDADYVRGTIFTR